MHILESKLKREVIAGYNMMVPVLSAVVDLTVCALLH